MKKIYLTIALLFSINTLALNLEEVPSDYCNNEYAVCKEPTIKIVNSYFTGSAPLVLSDQALFVGSCYMVGEGYNPEQEQYAYIYFRRQSSQFGFYGSFAFMFSENPYQNMTVAEASEKNPEVSTMLIAENSKNWNVMANENPPIEYFFRQSPDQSLSMIGFWGSGPTINCKLYKK